MTSADRRIAANSKGQLGSSTRDQAHEAGLTDRQLRRRVQSGFLEESGVSTFGSPLSERTTRAELVALLLDIGAPCWASSTTAAALHGFDGFRLKAPSTSPSREDATSRAWATMCTPRSTCR